ncbi:MAG: HAD family hydrolase [Acidimicrobiales bacterium]
MTDAFDAVSLDVGGVLVVPDHDVLADALRAAGLTFDRSRFGIGHYRAMAAVDVARSADEDFTDYLDGFIQAVDVPTDEHVQAHDALAEVLATAIWRQPVGGSREGVQTLVDAGVRLAVTSNSDGTIAAHLRAHEWLQIGTGPGAMVEVITDSGVLGIGKPNAVMFETTVAGLGIAPGRVLHVGDSVHYDIEGAVACGLQAVHMDPFSVCASTSHDHIRTLAAVLTLR